ncbi:MAG: hypothetical protein FWE92_04725, partial [Defluviitaleaceae bacterium]|nr:hypothetical protein [Defluviitaleaceae bacterium]
MGKFAKNFIISLLAYCIFIFLWLLLIVTLKDMVFGPLVIGRTPPPPPIWLQVIWWSEVPIFMSIYFYLGTKLNQLGNHLLNFLSVSWSLVFGLSMMAIGSYMLILPQLSFGAFTM